jgi:hypothetical protein
MAKQSYSMVNAKGAPNAAWVEGIKGIEIIKIGRTIVNGTGVTMLSPKSVAGPGKDGIFMVTKPSQPEMMYKSVNQASSDGAVQQNNLYLKAYEDVDPAGNLYLYPITTDGTDDPTRALRDFPWFDHTIGVIAYEGTGTESGTLDLNTFNLKTIMGFECSPLPGSTLNPLARPSAVPDAAALEWLSVFNHAAPDALPAYMNAEGVGEQVKTVLGEADDDTKLAMAHTSPNAVISSERSVRNQAGNPYLVNQNTPLQEPRQRRRRAPAKQPKAPKQQKQRPAPNPRKGEVRRKQNAPNRPKSSSNTVKLNNAKQLGRKEQSIATHLSNLLNKIKLGKK